MTSKREVLVELIDRIDAADDTCSYAVGAVSAAQGWHTLGGLLDDTGAVESLIGALVDHEAAGHCDVAGSYLASRLAGPIAHLIAAAWLDGGRVLQLEDHHVSVRFHEDRCVRGVAIADAGLTVGAADPAAGLTGVEVVHDVQDRRRLVADQIQVAAAAIFDTVRAAVSYGRAGMWGSLADGLAGTTLYTEQRRPGGGHPALAWARIDALLDQLGCQVPELRARPRRQLIPWSGGTRHQSVRGTCCLYYKTCVDPDPSGDGYCNSCPHRSDDSRAARITRWLEGQHA